jgi:transketolase
MVKYNEWKAANPELATELENAKAKKILQYVTKLVPQYVSGSADLHGSNKNYINGGNNFGNPKIKGKSFAGRNFYFGIREHAMGTMVSDCYND